MEKQFGFFLLYPHKSRDHVMVMDDEEMVYVARKDNERGMAKINLIHAAPDLLALTEAYEQWEADILSDNECWAPDGMASSPRITNKHWERLLEIQAMRNEAMNKAAGFDRLASLPAPVQFGDGESDPYDQQL